MKPFSIQTNCCDYKNFKKNSICTPPPLPGREILTEGKSDVSSDSAYTLKTYLAPSRVTPNLETPLKYIQLIQVPMHYSFDRLDEHNASSLVLPIFV